MSKVKTERYRRKSFEVDVVQVTPENMQDVAKWCGGKIMKDGEKEGHLSRDYIRVRVAYPINERQTQAFLSDWILKSGKSFKVYSNPAFLKSFEPIDDPSTPSRAKALTAPKPTAPKKNAAESEPECVAVEA